MHGSLADMLAGLAEREPERRIFTFLYPDGAAQGITAGRLHGDAGRIAAQLRDAGVRPGDLLPLVFDHGYALVAAFWAGIYLGAVPTILPYVARGSRSQAYLDQVERLARFTRAATVVGAADLKPYLAAGLADLGARIIGLADPAAEPAAPGPAGGGPVAAASDPPYIQFSSGTTGLPKGVLLTHAALLEYCRISVAHFAVTAADVTVGWLPLYHDMGLVNQIFEPLSLGRHSVLISPAAWLNEPHRLLEAIHRFRGTITWMPNFAFRYCARRIRAEQIAGVDLSSWRVVGNASEPVLAEDLQVFAERFAPHGLRPEALTVSYGMAEHVAGVTWTAPDRAPRVDWVRAEALQEGQARPGEPGAAQSRAIVSCGAPMASVTLRIAGPAADALPERTVGEVLVRSPLVFRGYYRLPEDSAAALAGGWLHTGDLGYVADGELYVCGRRKDLIIVGGRNIHPNQLEAVAAAVLQDAGRFAASFGVLNPRLGTEVPVVVCEMRQPPDPAAAEALRREIRAAIHRALEVFVADVHLVDKGWIVKTTSGKINRAANREKYLAERPAGAAPVAPARAAETTTHAELLAIWRELFGRADLDPDDDFFALGGDSLLAAQMAVEIEARLGRALSGGALLAAPTVAMLAARLDAPAAAPPVVVPLHPPGPQPDRPIFFCVHGLGGGVLDYRPLAQALGPRQPFYGVQACGLDGGPIDDRLETMAARYVEAITAVQPAGPYHLGGYCFGGVVAFEMGRQLRAAGHEVALVAILEGYAPTDAAGPGPWREWRFAVDFVRTLPFWLRDYLRLGRMQMRLRNRRLLGVARKRLLRLSGLAVELDAGDLVDGLASRPAQIQRLIETHLGAARRYAPAAPYDGRVVLFRTPRRLLRAPERDMGWGRLSNRPVAIEPIAGAHGTILEPPHVLVLADRLRRHLSGA